jgi:hypothetical protein
VLLLHGLPFPPTCIFVIVFELEVTLLSLYMNNSLVLHKMEGDISILLIKRYFSAQTVSQQSSQLYRHFVDKRYFNA